MWKYGYRKFYQRKFSIFSKSLKEILTFSEKYFFIFQKKIDRKKKLRIFSNHYIDVKFSGESIFRILGAIWHRWSALSAIRVLFYNFDSDILGPAPPTGPESPKKIFTKIKCVDKYLKHIQRWASNSFWALRTVDLKKLEKNFFFFRLCHHWAALL